MTFAYNEDGEPVMRARAGKMTHEIVPQAPILSKQTYASPMSFVGATKRIMKWADRPRSTAAGIAVWTGIALGLIIVWALLVCWYALIFGLFGIFTFPYRLIRRSQRKGQHVQRVQLATMQAMMAGQMKNDDGKATP